MAHECTHGSCSPGASQSSPCGCGGKCGCGNGNKCCCGSKCSCSCHQGGQCKYSDQLLQLADQAWMEVLKEKIKEEIRQKGDEQLSQLAKLVSTANHERWKDKMRTKKDHEDFEVQLKDAIFSSKK